MDFKEYCRRGAEFFHEGKTDLALENYGEALKLQPDNVELQQMINHVRQYGPAIAELIRKQSEAAIAEAKKQAGFMESFYGVKLDNIMDVDKIIAKYSQNPNQVFTREFFGSSRSVSAKQILCDAYYIQGLIFESKREFPQAARAYSEALNNVPDSPRTYKSRGRVNLEIGKIENCTQAVEDYKKANLDNAELKERLVAVYKQRAGEYFTEGDDAHAAEDCERILELDSGNSDARGLLDMAKERQRQKYTTKDGCLGEIKRGNAKYESVPQAFWLSSDFCLASVESDSKALKYVPLTLWEDADFCLAVVQKNYAALDYVPDRMLTPKISAAAEQAKRNREEAARKAEEQRRAEQAERERLERERLAKEKAEREERERLERERQAKEKAEREAREAEERKREEEERIRRKNEQDQRDYDSAVADLRDAKSKIATAQTSWDFGQLISEFSRIAQKLRPLPGSFNTQAQIAECETYGKQCEEKKKETDAKEAEAEAQRKKNDILSRFNTAKTKKPAKRTAYEYGNLAAEFSSIGKELFLLPSSVGVQAEINECATYRRKWEQKKQAKERRERANKLTKKVTRSLLYFGIAAGLLFIFIYFREALSFSADDTEEVLRPVVGGLVALAGAICGFFLAKETSGCLAVFIGIPVGGGIGFLLGYFVIGWLFVFLTWILWITLTVAVLVLAIVFCRKVISWLGRINAGVLMALVLAIVLVCDFVVNWQIGSLFKAEQNEQGTVTITGYSGKKRVVIPDTYNDMAVTEIGENAFKGKRLTSVTIPDSVISIGNYAFAENKLIDVTIGNSVTSIGDSAFAGTFKDWEFVGNQLTSVVIPDSVTAIGKSAFEYNQLTSVVIPDGVTAIGASAFAYNHLDNVSIPNSVTTIGSNAFAFNWLTSVVIPDNVITIRSGAFYNNALTSVVIPDSVKEIGQGAFADNHVTSIRLGTNVELREAELRVGKPWFDVLGEVLGKGTRFSTAYSNNKKKAGTYTRPDTKSSSWTWKQ